MNPIQRIAFGMVSCGVFRFREDGSIGVCDHEASENQETGSPANKMLYRRHGENAKHLKLEAVDLELYSPKVILNRESRIASLSGRSLRSRDETVKRDLTNTLFATPSRIGIFSQLAKRSESRME